MSVYGFVPVALFFCLLALASMSPASEGGEETPKVVFDEFSRGTAYESMKALPGMIVLGEGRDSSARLMRAGRVFAGMDWMEQFLFHDNRLTDVVFFGAYDSGEAGGVKDALQENGFTPVFDMRERSGGEGWLYESVANVGVTYVDDETFLRIWESHLEAKGGAHFGDFIPETARVVTVTMDMRFGLITVRFTLPSR